MRSAQNNWDFWTLLPETFHQTTIVMSDRGITASFRNMHFYGEAFILFIMKKMNGSGVNSISHITGD